MSVPNLTVVFDYLALLVAERAPDQPFLIKQVQSAILYKFPRFTFGAYGFAHLKAFLEAGEKAGYFRLINTGDPGTMYLQASTKRAPAPPAPFSEKRLQGAFEMLLSAERADQIMVAVRGVDLGALDQYLAGQERSAESYSVRGKTRRLRTFVNSLQTLGEWEALPTWKPSRPAPSMPLISPVGEAPRITSTVWAILGGNQRADAIPPEALTDFFFGVISYLRERLTSARAWDWLAGLDLLTDEFRTARNQHTARRGRTGDAPDDLKVAEVAAKLRREAGIVTPDDLLTLWEAYSTLEGSEGCFRFLKANPILVRDAQLLEWLDDQITAQVEKGAMDQARGLTSRAAVVVGVQRYGINGAQQRQAELEQLSQNLEAGAELLALVIGFLRAQDGLLYLDAHPALLRDEGVANILDDQLHRAAKNSTLERFRRVSERTHLWHSLLELGRDQGIIQHQRYLSASRDERAILLEMGLLLLGSADSLEARRDILERYAVIASREGLALANGTVEMLTLRDAPTSEVKRYHVAARLIERALAIGIDRALAELK